MNDFNEFKKIVDILNYKYVKANTKSKMDMLANDLLMMSIICEKYFSEENFDISWKDQEGKLEKIISKLDEKFIANIEANNKDYFELFYSTMEHILKSKINFYKYARRQLSKIGAEEQADIFYSFLKSYDVKAYNYYIDMLNNGQIYTAPLSCNLGETLSFTSLNNSYIFIDNEIPQDLRFGTILSHEFGHAMESNLYMKNGKSNVYLHKSGTPFYEVSSSFMEYAFMKYLKENNIHTEDVNILLYNYYFELLLNAISVSILSSMPNISNEAKEYDDIDISSYGDYIRSLETNYDCYILDQFFDENIVPYSDSYIYGIGQLFSIYLYDEYKKDPEKFKLGFAKALLNYKDLSSFKSVGITKDKIKEGKVLRRELSK